MIPSSIPSASPCSSKQEAKAPRKDTPAPPYPRLLGRAPSRPLLRSHLRSHVRFFGAITGSWSRKLEECSRLRRAYQHHQAAGFDDPAVARGEVLSKLDRTRELAEAEIGGLKAAQERVERLELDRDALLKSMAAKVPEDLDGLTGTSATRSTGCSGSPSRPPPRASRSPGR